MLRKGSGTRALLVLLPLGLACSKRATPTSTPPTAKGHSADAPAPPTAPPTAPNDACARVASRFDVMVAPLAAEAGPPEEQAAMLEQIAAMRVILLDECRQQPWPGADTTCFEQSADADAWRACEEQLPAALRANIQARLDAIPRNDPPEELARQQVRKIAFEYYPQWAMRPRNRGCPASLAELAEFAEEPAPQPWLDPWGTTLSFACEGGMLVVTSAGPDRKPGTSDDISSNL